MHASSAGHGSATGSRKRLTGLLAGIALAVFILALSSAPAMAAAPQTATVLSLKAGFGTIQIKGNVDPGDEDANWWAETSTDNEHWSGYPGVFGEFPAHAGPQPIEVEVSNEQGDPEKFLKGSTRYYVRLVLSNGVTNSFSFQPNSFVTTLAVDPPKVLSVNDASAVSYTTAKLSGSRRTTRKPRPGLRRPLPFRLRQPQPVRPDRLQKRHRDPCTPNPLTAPGSNPVSAESHRAQTRRQLPLPGRRRECRWVRHPGRRENLHHDGDLAADGHDRHSHPGSRDGRAFLRQDQSRSRDRRRRALYEVNWRFECTPKCLDADGKVLTGPPIPPDNLPHTVGADVVLENNTEYRVKLVATNAGASATAGPVFITTPPAPPIARTLGVRAGSDSADLGAKVNPLNSPVTYQFEWGLTDSYGNLAPATPEPLPAREQRLPFRHRAAHRPDAGNHLPLPGPRDEHADR